MTGDLFIHRTWYTADVRRGADGVWLHVRRGTRHVTIWRSTLDPFDEHLEPAERIEAEIGDAFVCCGPSIDETVLATVLGYGADRSLLRVDLGVELAATTRVVQLLGLHGLRQAKKRKAA